MQKMQYFFLCYTCINKVCDKTISSSTFSIINKQRALKGLKS